MSTQAADDQLSNQILKEAAEMTVEPEETKLILYIPTLPEQEPELCAGCQRKMRGKLRGSARYCEYFGTYFCQVASGQWVVGSGQQNCHAAATLSDSYDTRPYKGLPD